MKAFGSILRVLLTVNFILFFVTFIPAFSGIGPQPGLADRLLGNYRFGGWRADVVWVCASTVIIFIFGLTWVSENRAARFTIIAYGLWLLCFCIYLGYTVIHMFG